ncbi:MAG: shikimate dehydrogenase [Desulfuromonadaceae bacterium]
MTTASQRPSSLAFGVNGHTQVYAILGWPVAHSLSPLMQNAAFAATGIDAVYVPFPVREAELANGVTGLRALAICGCNVTVPHKEKIAQYLDCLSPDAQAIGAVNTIVRQGDILEGHNTDAGGFITSLERDLGFTPFESRVLVLGAGGAARACVYALARAQAAHICVANRSVARAETICRDFSSLFSATNMTFCGLDAASIASACLEADLIVNTTSLGMIDVGADPLPWGNINSKTLFYDVVYKAGLTPMVASAREHGLHAVDGLGMLIAQGEQAFRIWTGIDPGDAMRRSLPNGI